MGKSRWKMRANFRLHAKRERLLAQHSLYVAMSNNDKWPINEIYGYIRDHVPCRGCWPTFTGRVELQVPQVIAYTLFNTFPRRIFSLSFVRNSRAFRRRKLATNAYCGI